MSDTLISRIFYPTILNIPLIHTMAESDIESQLLLALDALSLQNKPNFAGTARTYKVKKTTLRARFLGIHRSRADAYPDTHQHLSATQEEVLISHINRLTNRDIPPTSQMVRNFAEEIIQDSVGHN